MRLIIGMLLTSLMTTTANAEVIKSTAEGFIIQHSATITKDIAEVFQTMVGKVGHWWSPAHSFSGDAGNMLIDSECFCERWGNNLVRHLDTVILIEHSKVIMKGGLGPLKELGLNGTMIWTLASTSKAVTTVSWKYHVYGYSETNMAELAIAVDGVLKEQIDRLTGYLEGKNSSKNS